MSGSSSLVSAPQAKEVPVDLSQAAGTFDLLVAGQDLLVELTSIYCVTVGATFTSVAIQTNQATPVVILSAADGVVVNITAGKNITSTLLKQAQPFQLRSGQKIQYTMVGATGSGSLRLVIAYRTFTAVAAGATI